MGSHPTQVAGDLGESPRSDSFDVFLSYSRADERGVHKVAAELKRAGVEPWLDAWCLTGGRPWQVELAEGLRRSAACAVFVGPTDMGVWEREEFHVALDRAAKDPTFRVFLVLLPGVPEPFDAGALSPFLSTRTWVDLRRGVAHPRAFQDLLHAVKGIPFGDTTPVREGDVCPYRGLAAFDEDDVEFFFGREAEVQRLVEKLKASPFLAVVGPSGSGKSSLTRAGLIPVIRRGVLPNSDTWAIPIFRPGPHPLDRLAGHLAREIPDLVAHEVRDELAADPRTLRLLLAGRPEHDRKVMGVVDQFEEVFTLCIDEHERRMFVLNILHASSADGPGVVVLTMRADFYPRCAAYPELAQQLSAHQFLVGPMDDAQLRQVIEEPARQVGLRFEPGLVDTILDDVRRESNALPLLQHALLELWKRRLGDTLTLEGYHDSGGVTGALARRADAVWAELGTAEQQTARRVMLRLTQPGEGTEDTRRRAMESELVSSADAAPSVERVVQALTDARLLTANIEADTGRRLIDVTHEALIRGWPQLRRWIDEDREGLREHQRLSEAAREWRELDRDPGSLYRGARLAAAREWAEDHADQLNELEREFVDASRAAEVDELEEAQRRSRRLRMLLSGAVVLLVVAIAAASVAFVRDRAARIQTRRAETQAQIADTRLLLSRAAALRSSQPDVSILLTVKALRDAPEEVEEEARLALLLNVNRELHRADVIFAHAGGVSDVAFGPEGSLVATGGYDGRVRLWGTDGQEVRASPLLGHEGSVALASSPDGTVLASAGYDGTILLWDVASGRQRLQPITGHEDEVTKVAFGPRGGVLASSDVDGTIRLWDADTGRRMRRPIVVRDGDGEPTPVRTLAFVPDGSRLVTGSDDGTVRVWDVVTGRQLRSPRNGHEPGTRVNGVAVSADGERIASGGEDGTVRLWDADTGRALAPPMRGHGPWILDVAFSPDDTLIASAGKDRTVRLWNARTGTPHGETITGHTSGVRGVAFHPDGLVVGSAGYDGTVRLTSVEPVAQTVRRLPGEQGSVLDVEFDARSTRMASAGDDGSLRQWDVAAASGDDPIAAHDGSARSVVYSPDGSLLASGGIDSTVRLWDSTTGQEKDPPIPLDSQIRAVDVSPDGSTLVTASDGWTAHLWDIATRQQKGQTMHHGGQVIDVEFSPDGNLVATASEDSTVRLWDAATGRAVGEPLTGHIGWVLDVAWSPDGRLLASAGGEDSAVRLWEVPSGRPHGEPLTGHAGEVNAVAFTSEGSLLASASQDATVRLWRVDDGSSPGEPLVGHTGAVLDVDFSNDGALLATAGVDGTVRWWQLQPDRLIADACDIANRNLSDIEWQRYLGAATPTRICPESPVPAFPIEAGRR